MAPDLPIDDPRSGWEERIAPALGALATSEPPYVVVPHSAASGYGALVAERVDAALLIYLCPRLAELDAPAGAPAPFRPGFPFPPRRPDGATVWEREAAIRTMYGRLDRAIAYRLADRLRPSAPPRGDFPMLGPPGVPRELVYTTEDEFFEPMWELFMAREVLRVEPVEIPGGHFPMAEMPDRLAALFDDLARRQLAAARS